MQWFEAALCLTCVVALGLYHDKALNPIKQTFFGISLNVTMRSMLNEKWDLWVVFFF